MPFNEVVIQGEQKFTLTFARNRQTKIATDVLQKLEGRQNTVENIGIAYISTLKQVQQAADQQRFSCTHFSRQHDKSFVLSHSIIESNQSVVMLFGGKQKRGVRRNLKRITVQVEKLLVHDSVLTAPVS